MALFQIFVGPPEDDKIVSVSDDKKVSEILSEANVSLTGMVQHNGKTLRSNDLNKTLKELGFRENDALHVVRKMDGAKG